MKRTILVALTTFLAAAILAGSAAAAEIYITEYASEADAKVFVTKYQSEANCIVYETNYSS